MIKLLQDYLSSDKSRIKQLHDIREKREATSIRQTTEWGMHGLQASFPYLRGIYMHEEGGEQRIALFHSHLVGINHISYVYIPFLNQDASMEFA